jgi:hypothetical protein
MVAAYSAAFIDTVEAEGAERAALLPLAGAVSRGQAGGAVLLRNAGGKPLRLRAELLAEGSSRGEGAGAWHELAIYRMESGQVAVALRLARQGGAETGVHRARVFEDMDSASGWLEGFDPACDLSVDFDVADSRVSAAYVTLKAAALRDRAERLERAYRSLVGEMLFRLESEL